MSAQKAFGRAVFRLAENMFPQPDSDGLLQIQGIYVYTFEDKDHSSDSISDLAEVAIREIERMIQRKIAESGEVYYVHKLQRLLPAEFDDLFTILDRPQRIELYADTFRKGIVALRKVYKVQ